MAVPLVRRAAENALLYTKAPTPVSISPMKANGRQMGGEVFVCSVWVLTRRHCSVPVPKVSVFARRRGEAGKSTARMAMQVSISSEPRYRESQGVWLVAFVVEDRRWR